MRRLLIILLLVLLPIQAAWAAACAYCPDNCMTMSVTDASADDAGALNDDDDCNRCQLGSVGLLPSPDAPRGAPLPHKLSLFNGVGFPDSGSPDRPERPKWKRAA
jgi:hypothetical protein